MADRISSLLGEKFGVRGDLASRAARLRRELPREVSVALGVLVSAEYQAQHPELAAQVDAEATAEAYDLVQRYLNGIDPASRRRGQRLEILGSILFGLMVLGLGLVLVLNWRGFL